MAFFDELKRIEDISKEEEKASVLLKTLIEEHKKTLINRHLQEVYEGLKESIRQKFIDGLFRFDDEELRGSYKFKAFIPMNYNFEPPFPDGISDVMVEEAKKELDSIRTSSRVRIEPKFKLKKKRLPLFTSKTKCEGDVYFTGLSLKFFEELDEMMKADGIKLVSVTAPILSIGKMATLDYKQKVKSSYTIDPEIEHHLTYEEQSSITIRYLLEI